MEVTDYKCLHCGHEYKGPFDKKVPIERVCPKCSSNSIRKVKKKPTK